MSLLGQLSQLTKQRAAAIQNNELAFPPGRARDELVGWTSKARQAIDQVTARASDFEAVLSRETPDAPANAKPIGQVLYRELLLPRWRSNSFPNTDCSDAQPFC